MLKVSSKLFEYDASAHRFAVDISTLRWNSFPTAFTMESTRTGKLATFDILSPIRNSENEIEMVVYVSHVDGMVYHAVLAND